MKLKLPNLRRTMEALQRFDRGECGKLEVGKAYALDTSDRNSSDVAYLISPGPKNTVNPKDQSFVRRMVQLWLENEGTEGTE